MHTSPYRGSFHKAHHIHDVDLEFVFGKRGWWEIVVLVVSLLFIDLISHPFIYLFAFFSCIRPSSLIQVLNRAETVINIINCFFISFHVICWWIGVPSRLELLSFPSLTAILLHTCEHFCFWFPVVTSHSVTKLFVCLCIRPRALETNAECKAMAVVQQYNHKPRANQEDQDKRISKRYSPFGRELLGCEHDQERTPTASL